jgi:hypothetical protein
MGADRSSPGEGAFQIRSTIGGLGSPISGNDLFDGVAVVDLQPFLTRDFELTGV